MPSSSRTAGGASRQLVPAARPAYAGSVTGSFAEHRASGVPTGRAADPVSPISRGAQALGLIAVTLLGLSLVARAVAVGVGRGGDMFEFTVAFGFTILAAYLVLERRYPIRALGFVPFGVALALLLYRQQPAERRPAARAGPPERPTP